MNTTKLAGVGLTIAGAVLGVLSTLVTDRQQEERINKAVEKEFRKRDSKQAEEEEKKGGD